MNDNEDEDMSQMYAEASEIAQKVDNFLGSLENCNPSAACIGLIQLSAIQSKHSGYITEADFIDMAKKMWDLAVLATETKGIA